MSKSTEIIRFDWAAKGLLRDKANFDILEGLVSTILDQPIHIIELLESESNQRFPNDKFNRVDIKAKDQKGDIILIEIQLTRELYFLQRILFGVAKTITDHLSLTQRYENVKKVYSINILYFDFGKGSDYLYHGQNSLIGVNTGDMLLVNAKEKNCIKIVGAEAILSEYYILRINQFNSNGNLPIEQWMRYLKDGTIDPDTNVPGLVQAAERLTYLKMSREEQKAYEAYIDDLRYEWDVIDTAKYDGRLEGLEEGAKTTNLQNAKKMKDLGVDTEIISQVTSLSAEDIQRL